MRKRRGGGKGKRRHNGREGYREREGGTGRGKEGEGEGSVTLLSHEELLYLFRVFVQDLARAYVTSQLLKLSLAHHRLFLALRHGCGAEKPSNLSYHHTYHYLQKPARVNLAHACRADKPNLEQPFSS